MAAYEKIKLEVADGVATITLDDPETRNALSDQLLTELLDALRAVKEDDDARVVVLASSHEKVFSAGGNLGGFAADAPTAHKYFGDRRSSSRSSVELGELGKPSIVAAYGHVLAGSLGIALACDLIIAKDTAGFGTPEINVGLFPFMIMALIYRNVPRKKTTEMLLLGDRLTAEEAREAGIVNKVVPAEEFDAAVRRVGAEARVEVAAGDEARQGRDVAPDGHAAARRPRLPALPADDRASDRGRDRGRHGVLRKARTRMEGTMSEPLSDTDRAHRRGSRGARRDGRGAGDRHAGAGPRPPRAPREGEAGRRRGEDRQAARARQADRARAPRPPGRRGHLRRDGHPRPPALLAEEHGGQGRPRRRRHHRLGRGRRPHGRDRRLRLHRDGRLDGHDRRAEGDAPSRDRAEAADAADLAPRLGRRAHPGGGGLALRRLGPPLPRGGRDVGRRPDGRRDARPVRGRHRLHPGPLRLRADGRRPGRDGAGRART